MPDRIVRQGILTSDTINTLSWVGEIFYRRLMSVVDDFGRYEGRPALLRAALYPLKLDRVSDSDIVKWMGECTNAGLVRQYTVDGREYVEIDKFGQRLRAMRSKYPAPLTSADKRGQMTADCSTPPPESETNPNPNPKQNSGFDLNVQIKLPAATLEAIERNQFLNTKKNNTQFVQSQWAVFLYERIAQSAPGYYKQLEDLTGHFINWMREKFPKPGSEPGKTTDRKESVTERDARLLREQMILEDQQRKTA